MRANLPSWAIFLPKSTPKQSSMKEEEFELRLRAYHRATEILKHSYNASLQKHLSPCLEQILHFLLRFTPGKKRKRFDLLSSESTQDLCTSLVNLFPLAILKLSISTQDRTQIVSMIRQYFLNTKAMFGQEVRTLSTYRPAVCILKDSTKPKTKSRMNHYYYLREILVQCLQQERNFHAWSHLLENSHRASIQHSLLEWARSTTMYNAILIIFENPEAMPSEALDAFMNSITNLRSIECVPISMIMCSTYKGLVENKTSSLTSYALGGRAGVVIETFDLFQEAYGVYDEFVSTLYLKSSGENMCPLSFSGDLLHSVREDYCLYHNSVAKAYLQFQSALARHFVNRGSFLSMANDHVFASLWSANITWFCSDGLAREYVLGKDYSNKRCYQIVLDLISAEQESYMKRLLFRMLLVVISTSGLKDSVLFEGLLKRSIQYSDFLEKIYNEIRKKPIESFLSFVALWLEDIQSVNAQFQKPHCINIFFPFVTTTMRQQSSLSSLIKFVERALVLLQSLEEQNSSAWDFREDFISELHSHVWKEDFDFNPSLRSLFCVDHKVDDKFGSSSYPKPRTEIASAIADSTGILSDVYAAFYVFDVRVISTDGWFQRFVEEVANGELIEQLLQRFALAVYQLLLCGYVVRSQRRDDAFEKAAMAWATLH